MPTLGIFGGDEVAKMLVQAASTLNIDTLIFARHAAAPALKVSPQHLIGQWDDEAALVQFAQRCDVITCESRAVGANALAKIEAMGTTVFPSSATLVQAGDLLDQKRHLEGAGIDLPRYKKILVGSDVLEASVEFGFPLLLKARTDSDKRALIRRAHDIEPALQMLEGHALIAEALTNFVRELVVTITRNSAGEVRNYPVVEMTRHNQRPHIIKCPAAIDESTAYLATEMAIKAVQAVGGVGTFGIELFEMPDNQVVFNELFAHPHAAGHYTIEGVITSQFENHVRAVMGLPLGDVAQIAPAAAMVTLIGEQTGTPNDNPLQEALAVGGTHCHIYGKAQVVPGELMGHITALGYNADGAEKVARLALSKVRL